MKNLLVLRILMIIMLLLQIVIGFFAATNTVYVAAFLNLLMIYFLVKNHEKVFGWVQFYSILFILGFAGIYLFSGLELRPDLLLMSLLVSAAINVVLSTWVIKKSLAKHLGGK